ncbi:MAG: hypothetical protein PHF00_03665 [Elusimicrobia bacterium]|nr:hypothetical protein [Elusimicrobiota bacterium]
MISSAWALSALLAVPGRAETAAVAASSAAAPGASAVSTATVSGIYTAERLRDPFARWGAGRGGGKAFTLEDFSIHKLTLTGMLKDPAADFAIFSDADSGLRFILRKGRLYDSKNKPVPGIGGTVNMKEKMATLTAPEGDVQVFRLGEEEKE